MARIGSVVERRDTVLSTMDAVRKLDADGAVLVAARQTAGRGRLDRSWHSPPGGLYLSFRIEPDVDPDRLGLIPLWTGLAVLDVVEERDVDAWLSWPNDVRTDAGKLAGVLAESTLDGDRVAEVVVGVGLNVNVDAFPDDVPGTSLELETGRRSHFDDVLDSLLDELTRRDVAYRKDPTGFLDAYEDRCGTVGRPVRVRGPAGTVEGRATGIGSRGELVVDTSDGPVRVDAGDVEEIREGAS